MPEPYRSNDELDDLWRDIYLVFFEKGGKYFVLGYVEHRTLMKETAGGKPKKEKASAQPVF
jgi:hypothetical protein